MGVDGIDGPGRPVRSVGTADPGVREVRAEAAKGADAPHAASGPAPSPALERLERGEIDLNQYLDARVDDAVRHLDGRLPAAQLDFVRQTLRDELATDPVLAELVRRTTGSIPTPRTD